MDNYTSLDNTSLGNNTVNSGSMGDDFEKKNKLANLLSIGALAIFSLSITYAVIGSQFTTGTKAAAALSPTPVKNYNFTILDRYTKLPKTYKGTEIPQRIYDEAAAKYGQLDTTEKKQYVNKMVMMYLMYHDVLAQEADYDPVDIETLSFTTIEDDLIKNLLEQQVNERGITNMDYCFVSARFALGPNPEKLKEKYPDVRAKAKELVEKYQNLLNNNPEDAESIVAASNDDEDIKTLNNERQINECHKNYTLDKKEFYVDPGFNQLLLKTEEGTTSEIYTIKPDSLPEHSYVVTYMQRVAKHPINSLEELIETGIKDFTF
jgi:hypothetical protein